MNALERLEMLLVDLYKQLEYYTKTNQFTKIREVEDSIDTVEYKITSGNH